MKKHFRTIVQPTDSTFSLNHNNSFLLVGSCFSENIGEQLKKLKFNVLNNPLGISYNPISIHQLLNSTKKNEVLEKDGIFFSYNLHSELNGLSKNEIESNYKKQQQLLDARLAKKGVLFISYGTAWVYELKTTKSIVNNCQKQANDLFTKRLLEVDEIVDSFNELYALLNNKYEQQQIIFTVSPVRHLKDGYRENQLSKSILHLAINRICNENSACSYFPSYEIMMDDLRDYRFYKNDFLHPNEQAIEYIWQQFSETYFSNATLQLNHKLRKINNALQHKAFLLGSESHQKFLQNLLEQIKQVAEKNNLNFTKEISAVKQQIL